MVLLCALAFVANIFRLYSRWYLNSRFDTDDWIMLAVAVVLVPFQVCGEYGNFLAFGVDTWYVAPEDLTTGLQVRNSRASPPLECDYPVRYAERPPSFSTSARRST